jgi:hypothetical protein
MPPTGTGENEQSRASLSASMQSLSQPERQAGAVLSLGAHEKAAGSDEAEARVPRCTRALPASAGYEQQQ